MQLMKMLWCADNEAFKEHGKSITGLVYKRDKEGIIPIGYNGIIDLENVLVKEEIEGENVRYKIQNNDSLDMSYLSDEELKIIDKVGDKTRNYSLKEMTEFVKNKKEYMDVNDGDIISFK